MSGLNWLLYGNIVVWLGLGLYVAFLARSHSQLKHRITQMEIMSDDSEQD